MSYQDNTSYPMFHFFLSAVAAITYIIDTETT